MKRTPERKKLDAALKAYEKATEKLYDAAEQYTRAEVAAVAQRYPRRRVEYMGGMGVCSITISKHGMPGEYQICEAYGDQLRDREIPVPEFMKVLGKIEVDTRLPGMGDAGLIAFEHGKEMSK